MHIIVNVQLTVDDVEFYWVLGVIDRYLLTTCPCVFEAAECTALCLYVCPSVHCTRSMKPKF